MKGVRQASKFSDSLKERSYGDGPAANRYEYEFHHGRVRGKLYVEKGELSAGRSLRNFNGVSSALSPLSKVSREGWQLKAVRTTATAVSPLVTGTIMGAVAMGFYGVANVLRYRRNEKSGVQAIKDTVMGSAGVGVSTVIAVTAANVVAGTSLAFGSAVIVPLVAGFAAAYVSTAVWDKLFYKGKCPSKFR